MIISYQNNYTRPSVATFNSSVTLPNSTQSVGYLGSTPSAYGSGIVQVDQLTAYVNDVVTALRTQGVLR